MRYLLNFDFCIKTMASLFNLLRLLISILILLFLITLCTYKNEVKWSEGLEDIHLLHEIYHDLVAGFLAVAVSRYNAECGQ